ncbi:cell division protein FtsL [Levilactobacillus bambusae]|uniref:Cell division protein FtsL n=1 Tax=Levilactobacillus bambusae TaxID=2024736 RepID=A0A2V1N0U2_9LACO|nr:cell division protein FtsL [Levilactobacillus bambusae]PWG00633.1 cell division protein FtsL [Levilactobacillus bambusae]
MAQNNLAQQIPDFQPEPKSRSVVAPLHKNQSLTKPEKLPVSKFEKCLMVVCGLVLTVLMISIVSAKIAMSGAQRNLQGMAQEVTTLQGKNSNARQQISELQSKSRLDTVAKQEGLSLSNEKIRNVNK